MDLDVSEVSNPGSLVSANADWHIPATPCWAFVRTYILQKQLQANIKKNSETSFTLYFSHLFTKC